MIKNEEPGVESWRIGTLVHIFDVSSATGSISFMLEHSNQGASADARNVESFARLTAVALTTASSAYRELSNAVKRIDTEVTTTSSTYAVVTGTTTNAITLPIKGDIFVTASINSNIYTDVAGTNLVTGEYRLESSPDGTAWSALGKPVKYTLVNKADDGIISLVGILQDQNPGINYQFRVAHRRVSGAYPLRTTRTNIAAVALAHNGGGYFPTFYSEIGNTGVDVDWGDDPKSVTSSSFTAAANIGTTGPALFVSSQYLVDATNLDVTPDPDERMRAGNQLYIDDGTTTTSALEYYYYIPDNAYFGAAGFTGLVSEMTGSGSYTIGMQHEVAYVSNHSDLKNEILTTSEVILCGFQTYDQPHFVWDGSTNAVWETADNWSNNEAPTAASTFDVTIPNVTNQPVIAGTTRECNDIFILSGSTLTVEDGASLTVSGSLRNSGTLTIEDGGSLITNGTITDNGTINVEKTIAQDSKWHLISVPNNNSTTTDFSGYYLQEWDELTSNWIEITDLADPMPPCKGYGFYDVPAKSTFNFSGTPNTGEQSIDIYSNSSVVDTTGMNLIGNPYPSAIDWDIMNETYGAIYIWNPSSDDYIEWNGSSEYGIAPMQGFFVYSSTNTTFTIDNDARTHAGADTFYKSSNSEIENGIILSTNQQDKLYIKLMNEASNDFDFVYDAFKIVSLGESNSQLYSKYFDTKLAIDCRPETNLIQLGYQNNQNGQYSIELVEIDGIADAEIEDTKLNTFHNLQNGAYEFAWETSDAETRFKLHLEATGLGDLETPISHIFAYQKTINIRSSEKLNNAQVSIIDMMGRTVYEQTLVDGQNESIIVPLEDGVYIVQLVSDSGTQVEKVVLK